MLRTKPSKIAKGLVQLAFKFIDDEVKRANYLERKARSSEKGLGREEIAAAISLLASQYNQAPQQASTSKSDNSNSSSFHGFEYIRTNDSSYNGDDESTDNASETDEIFQRVRTKPSKIAMGLVKLAFKFIDDEAKRANYLERKARSSEEGLGRGEIEAAISLLVSQYNQAPQQASTSKSDNSNSNSFHGFAYIQTNDDSYDGDDESTDAASETNEILQMVCTKPSKIAMGLVKLAFKFIDDEAKRANYLERKARSSEEGLGRGEIEAAISLLASQYNQAPQQASTPKSVSSNSRSFHGFLDSLSNDDSYDSDDESTETASETDENAHEIEHESSKRPPPTKRPRTCRNILKELIEN